MWLIERLRHLGPEFLGGGAAYWTHHYFHKIWSLHLHWRRKP